MVTIATACVADVVVTEPISQQVRIPPGWVPGLFSFSPTVRAEAWNAAAVIHRTNQLLADGVRVYAPSGDCLIDSARNG